MSAAPYRASKRSVLRSYQDDREQRSYLRLGARNVSERPVINMLQDYEGIVGHARCCRYPGYRRRPPGARLRDRLSRESYCCFVTTDQ